jgi:phenylalanyl-tRNA synthetase beta chain
MKFSEHWLRTYVDPPIATQELARVLAMGGLEVESIDEVVPPFDNVVVGQVVEVARHPDADRLSLCRVDVGDGGPLAIVCGAPNVAVGLKVAVALVGASLPGLEIKRVKVRGVDSNGMLCSAKELGLSDDHSGLLVLAAGARIGARVREVLELDDRLFTLKLTPNRGDCLSMRGIAREVSILTSAALELPSVPAVAATIGDKRAIRLDNPEACPLYCGRILRGVNANASTPAWMVRRLERCGLRTVSAIVDITNYVMLELGQPLHAFDNRALEGTIIVRTARRGERLKVLNGREIDLLPDLLLIADEKKPLALGGVMGGDASGVTDSTTEVFLEAAWFNPSSVAGRARRLQLTSDAAFRFERGVDFAGVREAMERATRYLLDICGGEAGPVSEARATLPGRRPILMRTARAAKIVGVGFTDDQIAALLRQLRLPYERRPGEFTVTPPSHRFDLEIEEDIVEEVARLYGYDNVPSTPPRAELAILPLPEGTRSLRGLKRVLVERGYFEVVNFSFVETQWERDFCGNSEPIALQNPIAAQFDVMRSSLVGSLVATLRFNLARKTERVRVFEAGRCYLRSDTPVDPGDPARAVAGYFQPLRIAGIAYGPAFPEQWGVSTKTVDFYDLKGDVEALAAPHAVGFAPGSHPSFHPGRSAVVTLGGRTIGWLGELHPRWQQKYELPGPVVLFELEVQALTEGVMPRYQEISRFPPVIRDRAVVVDEGVPAGALLGEMERARTPLVHEIRLFDVFRGASIGQGKKSLAFRVVMQDTAKTLTDAEADAAMARLTELLSAKFGAKLRT